MRISDILVHQQGPLKKNFNLEAKGMNLIYGPNESGKTFIIEALMQWLFPKNSIEKTPWKYYIILFFGLIKHVII